MDAFVHRGEICVIYRRPSSPSETRVTRVRRAFDSRITSDRTEDRARRRQFCASRAVTHNGVLAYVAASNQ